MAAKKSGKSGPELGPTVFVLFGATGDLAKRLVLPAFYQLAAEGLLPRQWLLVGNGRGDVSHEDFRGHVHSALTEFGPQLDMGAWDAFSKRVLFAGGGFTSDSPGSLLDVLDEARKSLGGDPQLVHYLAVPPVAFAELTKALGQHSLARNARVVYEKPFGTSPESFRALDRVVHSVLDEQQVYRIDHFLGKEATQDLHVLRFANGLFAAMWDRKHVESVQIDVPEKLGITDRSVFYDATGAVLDMLVTHLFQVAAEIAMEPPASLGAFDLQAAREKVIKTFRPIDPGEVVLGQFTGYRDVPGVAAKSTQDTFVAARMWIDNPRWRGVPFYLRTGKRLAETKQRVSLILRDGRPARRAAYGRDERAVFLLGGGRRDRPVPGGQEARPGAQPRPRQGLAPVGQPGGRGPAAALRPADPRRPDRRSLPVHPPGWAGRDVEGDKPAALAATEGRTLCTRIVGTGHGGRAHRTRPLAARPVAPNQPRDGRPATSPTPQSYTSGRRPS